MPATSSEDKSVNLSAVCGPLPGGSELASGSYKGSLVITVTASLSMTEGMAWAVRVEKPRINEYTGRSLKPVHVLTLRANPGETPANLLRHLAVLWEHGNYVFGTPLEGVTP